MTIAKDQNHQSPVGTQADEFYVPDRGLVFGGQNQTGPLRQARQSRTDAVQKCGHVGFVSIHRRIDLLAVLLGHGADLKDAIDEHPQTHLRRHPSGRYVRAAQQAQKLQILHDVAHGGGADLFGHGPGQHARPDGIARGQIPLDHAAKHLARSVGHVGQDRGSVGQARASPGNTGR